MRTIVQIPQHVRNHLLTLPPLDLDHNEYYNNQFSIFEDKNFPIFYTKDQIAKREEKEEN